MTLQINKQDTVSVVAVSEETLVEQSIPSTKHEGSDQSAETQPANISISSEPEKPEKPHTEPDAAADESSCHSERVNNKAEGHIVSEPVQEDQNEPETHPNMSDVVAGIAILGGVVAIGGAIAGSAAVTALGVTAVVVGGACYLLKGK